MVPDADHRERIKKYSLFFCINGFDSFVALIKVLLTILPLFFYFNNVWVV